MSSNGQGALSPLSRPEDLLWYYIKVDQADELYLAAMRPPSGGPRQAGGTLRDERVSHALVDSKTLNPALLFSSPIIVKRDNNIFICVIGFSSYVLHTSPKTRLRCYEREPGLEVTDSPDKRRIICRTSMAYFCCIWVGVSKVY
eukprot:6190791-Pyramimonas_sp.AAC.1